MMSIARPRRILLVEDDSMVREFVRSRLASAGYDTHTARTGAEALARLVALRPDAMVLDLGLPELDGFEVLASMQSDMSDHAAPTLVLTASQSTDDVKRAVALGARDYLVKSSVGQTLLPRLARMLRNDPRPVA